MGRMAPALLCIWVMWLTLTAWSYISGQAPPMTVPGLTNAPNHVWSVVWLVPLGLILGSLVIPAKLSTLVSLAMSSTAALCGAWSIAFLMQWTTGVSESSWMAAKNYAAYMLAAMWTGRYCYTVMTAREDLEAENDSG